MNEQKAKALLQRYEKGELSPEEKLKLDTWYLEQAKNSAFNLSEGELEDSVSYLSANLPLVRAKQTRLWPRIAATAAAVAIIAFGIYFYTGSRELRNAPVEITAANDIAPGRQGATLTLANGQKILLGDAQNGQLANEAGVVISKTADGQLVYAVKGSAVGETETFNTLTTAKGETYSVVLPDQSKVWMNAGSSLRYSSALARLPERRVELLGEAYFEVAKDKAHPFVVKSGAQEVQVLGTHFNVNTYTAGQFATTLLEGSVSVSSGGAAKMIRPGEQAILSGSSISVKEVEAEYAVAWKNGFFMFATESLESIMGKLARWYNVEVEFADPELKTQTFFASVKRDVKISEVLKKLEGAGKMEFKLSGNTVVVSSKK
jgi:transmembrane sensor